MSRCKFVCSSIQQYGDSNTISLSAVTTGSEENKQFFKWTPGGTFVLHTVNPNVLEQFVLGKEYYIDITPCE